MRKKFDVVIGNPPYQDEATGDATHNMPVYHLFMEAAYEVGRKAVLITPARFLFNAGYTPKAWNEKMLSDPHLTVSHYVPNSDKLFPGTDIKGGIAVTYRDEDKTHEPIGTFTKSPVLNEILHKVPFGKSGSIASVITSSRSYRYTDEMHADYPEGLPPVWLTPDLWRFVSAGRMSPCPSHTHPSSAAMSSRSRASTKPR